MNNIVTLQEAREGAGLSRWELAKLARISAPTVANYENGKSSPHPDILARLHQLLEFDYVTVDDAPGPPLSHYRQTIPARHLLGKCDQPDSRLVVDWDMIDAGLARWREMCKR
jgi:transcriptional regulator with XRE-family HTH domain